MRFLTRLTAIIFLVCVCAFSVWSQEMSKEEWQKQITDLTTQRNDLKNKLTTLQGEVAALQKEDADKAAALKKCQDEMAAMVGGMEAPFAALLDKIDASINELSRLSNQDLWARRAELDSVQTWLDAAKKNALSVLPKYSSRISDEQGRLDALKKSLQQIAESGSEMRVYTVGTWARDRDCLWNIAKKPKIYANAFLWPKIWQGNRDEIKNPDLIYKGQRLKIPPKAELTAHERSALRSYWSKKHAAAAASNP
ncbi:MAG TPA: hypothetical protein VMM57_04135 [Bacteroidota bacterium]|nr:hypothetical protein [Bacteroidota bacterium]